MTTTTSHTMKATTEASAPTQSISRDLQSEVKYGVIDAYSVDTDRLMIKFKFFTSINLAMEQMLISAPADAPNFRSWVSMAMIAYQTDRHLAVRYRTPIPGVPQPSPEVFEALELGI